MGNLKRIISQDRILWFALVLILFFFGIIRYHLLDLPLQRDEGEYAYAGQLILQGVFPYQEVFNMKLPGIYAIYALFLSIFGQTHHGIHFGLLFINSITTLFVFLLAKKIMDPLGALISAACFALLSVSPSVQGTYANAEHFVILFAIPGLLLMLHALEKNSLGKLFLAGILLGISLLMKQHGIAFILFSFLFIVFDAFHPPPFKWKKLWLKLIIFGGGVSFVFGVMCFILFKGGVFKNFWFWTVEYALTYIARVTPEEAWQYFSSNVTRMMIAAPLLWLLIFYGFWGLTTKKLTRYNKIFLLLFFLFSSLSVCPGFYFRKHYFLLILPCVSLFAGVTVSVFLDFVNQYSFKKIFYSIPILFITISLVQSFWIQRDFFFYMTPFQASRLIYGVNPFPESIVVADFIKKNTTPDDCVAIFGSEPQIFFYAHRRSASGYIYMYPMMENHPFAAKMQKDFIKDIKTKFPKYILFIDISTSWLRSPDSDMGVLNWLQNQVRHNQIRLVGEVNLYQQKSVYHWGKDVKTPKSSFSILVFENSNQRKKRKPDDSLTKS